MNYGKCISWATALCGMVFLAVPQTATAADQFSTLDYPGAVETQLFSVSDNGAAVGFYIDANYGLHGFRWFEGQFTSIDVPGAWFTMASGINNAGHIVGSYMGPPDGRMHGFLLIDGSFTTITYPDSFRSMALGINNGDAIVGSYVKDTDYWQGFMYTASQFINIDVPNGFNTLVNGVNDHGQVSGSYEASNGPNSYTWYGFVAGRNGFSTVSVGAALTEVGQISNNGSIVGDYVDNPNGPEVHGFTLISGDLETHDFPSAVRTWVQGVNNNGWTVGRYLDSNNQTHGFISVPQ